MTPEIVTATAEHIPMIAAQVREADRAELWAAACQTPEQTMTLGLRISEMSWTGLMDGIPVCMFGVVLASVLGNIGRPWMVGTHHLDEHPTVFLRRCKGCVKIMMDRFNQLENYVDVRNEQALRWLTWLGFSFQLPAEKMGPFNMPFVRFEMRR